MTTPAKVLRRRLVFYVMAFSYAVTILVGAILAGQDRTISRSSVISAVGLNLISSAVFGVVFVALSSRYQEGKLEEDLEDRFIELSEKLVRHAADGNRQFLPAAIYPPVDGFDRVFNIDLSRSLSGTGFYGFRGPSPRYVPPRLTMARHPPQQVRICMLDPGDEKALARHASDRLMRPGLQDVPVRELALAIRREIVASIVVLFDCRHICPIELIYFPDTSVDRVEIFDDSIYVSWYHGPSSPGHLFPEAYRFLSGSLFYETQRLDMNRRSEISEKRVVFGNADREADLLAHLSVLTGNSLDETFLSKARHDHAELVSHFVNFLEEFPIGDRRK